MNAPQERGQESFKKVQLVVLMDEICSGTADENTFAMMRVVSEHLPEKARALWVEVEKISEELDRKDYDMSNLSDSEKAKINELKNTLISLNSELSDFIDSFVGLLDPETVSELSTALEEKDVSCVNRILENCADIKERIEAKSEDE